MLPVLFLFYNIISFFFFSGLLDSGDFSSISNYLDIGLLANWFTKVNTQLSRELYFLLFQRLFESSLAISSSFQQLQTGLPVLQKYANTDTENMQELEASIALFHVLSKVFMYILYFLYVSFASFAMKA